MTEEEALLEFLHNFDGNKDGTVTLAEFREYYTPISASVDRDDYFVMMVEHAWGLDGGAVVDNEQNVAASQEEETNEVCIKGYLNSNYL